MTIKTATKQNTAMAERQKLVTAIKERLGDKTIVLVGMMGCGKSAVGRIVASSLGLSFHDADVEIETAAGMSVSEIFTKFGEEEFRRGEEKVIQRLVGEGPLVLALGGGAFISEKTRNVIAENGISIWLKADADLLLSRVMRKPEKRPLLLTDDPRKTLLDLLEKRSPIYALADVHVNSSRSSKSRTRDSVLRRLNRYLQGRLQNENSATPLANTKAKI